MSNQLLAWSLVVSVAAALYIVHRLVTWVEDGLMKMAEADSPKVLEFRRRVR